MHKIMRVSISASRLSFFRNPDDYYLFSQPFDSCDPDRFREHLRDVEINDKDASKPVARHFNLPNHSQKQMTVCGLSLHLGNTESRKNIQQKFIFQIGTLSPCGINECFSFF